MTTSTRVVIRHLSGSKVNQIEQFDLDGLQDISFGRDSGNKVAYDFQRDDEVSRRHAVIRIKSDKDLYFRIADLNSSNGTFLNGERIAAEVELLPDDVVELGEGGPKFAFDVQPRPANMPARTRSMTALGAIDAAATRVVAAATQSAATTEHAAAISTQQRTAVTPLADKSAGAKVPVGKLTIQRMLFEERRSVGKIWGAALAAVLVVAVVGGVLIYRHGQNVAGALQQQVADQADINKTFRSDTQNTIAKQAGLSSADIRRLGDATVYIDNVWQLYDWSTNRPLYQKMTRIDGIWMPAYIRLDDGTLVRWLTLEQNKDDVYKSIGKRQSGSGFVVGEQGFILTNKHVAAGWASRYEDFRAFDWSDGVVYNLGDRARNHATQRVNNINSLTGWVPESGGYVFEASNPRLISDGQRKFFGRNEVLTVQFPGTRIDFNANLLRTSIDADIAEIKIDTPQPLSKLALAEDNTVSIGDKITLLGYPDVSQSTIAVQQSNEGGVIRNRSIYIPEPTVTQGIVSKMPTRGNKRDEGGVTTFGTIGDMYQLDIFAGPGSSGGPVLNSAGQVIALLSLGSASAEHVSFAVPVSYVRELLQPQRNASP